MGSLFNQEKGVKKTPFFSHPGNCRQNNPLKTRQGVNIKLHILFVKKDIGYYSFFLYLAYTFHFFR